MKGNTDFVKKKGLLWQLTIHTMMKITLPPKIAPKYQNAAEIDTQKLTYNSYKKTASSCGNRRLYYYIARLHI